MEDDGRSPLATEHGPLLPTHHTPGRPLSAGSPEPPSPPRESPKAVSADVHPEESDIADVAPQIPDKPSSMLPSRRYTSEPMSVTRQDTGGVGPVPLTRQSTGRGPISPTRRYTTGVPMSPGHPDIPGFPTSPTRQSATTVPISPGYPDASGSRQSATGAFPMSPGIPVSPGAQSAADVRPASVEEETKALEWIVPVQNGAPPEKPLTVGERLQSTLRIAKAEQLKYEQRAKWAGMAINGAMFAQIVSNALITGLSAATSNRHAQIGVSALGALGTIISSFLVRARGTKEPERSTTHAQNLERFIRELEAFILDEGYSYNRKWDDEVKRFRTEFDRLQTAVHQTENGQQTTAATEK